MKTLKDFIEPDSASDWYVAGTERTGQYACLVMTDLGLVAVRPLLSSVRVRVEPSDPQAAAQLAKYLTRAKGWTQPGDGGENRFSRVLSTDSEAIDAIATAIRRLGRGGKLARKGTRLWRRMVKNHLAAA